MTIRSCCCIAVFICVLFVACGHQAYGSSPKVTVFFTGNSFGEYKPCPTCGGHALGGLGRRATFFSQARGEHPGALFIAGGYEFVSYIKRREVRPELFEPMAKAYEMLGYDLGLVAPEESSALGGEGVRLPDAFRPVQAQPWSYVVERGGLKLGVLIFPGKAEAYARVDKKMKQAVAHEAAKLHRSVDAVVGVSTWGEREELGFADEHPGVVDVLLGAGPGTGYGVRAVGGEQTLWVRPAFDGRGVIRLDILSLPGADASWKEGRDFSFKAVELGGAIREDASVTNLFTWF